MQLPPTASPLTIQTGLEIVQSANFILNTNYIRTQSPLTSPNTRGITVRDMLQPLYPNTGEKIEVNSIHDCGTAIYLYNNLVVGGDEGLNILCNTMTNSEPSYMDVVSEPGPFGPAQDYGISAEIGHDPFMGATGSAANTFSSNLSPGQNFVYNGRPSDYYDDGSAPLMGFSGAITLNNTAPTFDCVDPGTMLPRLAPNNAGLTPAPLLSAVQEVPVVSPNPSRDGLYKLSGFGEARYVVTDMFGRSLASGSLSASVNTLDLSALAAGTYILTVQAEGGAPATYKLLRQ